MSTTAPPSLRQLLESRVRAAMAAADLPQDAPPVLVPAARPEFGDYQANGIMGAAKRLKTNPRELATKVVEALDLDDLGGSAEVAGPGFINIRLGDTWLGQAVLAEPTAKGQPEQPDTVVVDYSSPNLAKEMHVGHLRSTIIGDAVVRVLEHLGHRVVRQNHVGDWGTQFGMLITHLRDLGDDGAQADAQLADLEQFYRQAKQRFDAEPEFAGRARDAVVALQGGEAWARALWTRFIETSMQHCEAVYDLLDVSLTRADVMAESAYNDDLAQVVADLDSAGLLTEDNGAQCVFLDAFKGKDGTPLPVIVQKSDGGYLYATTDLAAVRHRAHSIQADRCLYFIDARQGLHMQQVFAVARAAGFAPATLELNHMPFGTMMGRDGRPFKTRSGDVVKLVDLLDEAVQRAADLVAQKNPELDDSERAAIARAVGIGAVKYADLSKNRTGDYVFDWEQMLSFEGNTAPYLQYAWTRVAGIFRKAGVADPTSLHGDVVLGTPQERTLALTILRLRDVLEQVARDGVPHVLCAWLYDLAGAFMAFYEHCPVLGAEEPLRTSRLLLARQTAAALQCGLGLLGIRTVERM